MCSPHCMLLIGPTCWWGKECHLQKVKENRSKKLLRVVNDCLIPPRPHGWGMRESPVRQSLYLFTQSFWVGIIFLRCWSPIKQVENWALWAPKESNGQHKSKTFGTLGFPGGSAGKESTCNVGDLGLIPGLGRSAGEGNGYPLQYSGLENSMDCIVHGVTKSWTRLSDFHLGH